MEPSDKIQKDIIGLAKYGVACIENGSKTRQKLATEEREPLVEIKFHLNCPVSDSGKKIHENTIVTNRNRYELQ